MRGREREKEIKQKEKERVSWGQRASDDRKKAFSEIGRVTKCQTKLEKRPLLFRGLRERDCEW